LHAGCVEAWASTGGRAVLNMSECADHGQRDDAHVRRMNWAAVMGGASAVQVLWMGRASDPPAWNTAKRYDDCATLAEFCESIDFNALVPSDRLALADAEYVLESPGKCYLAYSSHAKKELGVRNLAGGRYALTWLGCDGGHRAEATVDVAGGDTAWPLPDGFGGEVAVYAKRVGR
jgi:hypothetical protein